MGGAYGMVAAFHGPIEEQARLSIHPHIVLRFIHCQSERWLRSILRRETEEARELLRFWQEKVLATVQSMQIDSAAVLPLLLADDVEDVPTPRNTPFSERHQGECRMDGKLEGDVEDEGKRRPFWPLRNSSGTITSVATRVYLRLQQERELGLTMCH